MKKAPGQTSFEAYNDAGATPGKTWDGKDVPTWENLSDDVREKWATAELAAGRARLEAFGPYRSAPSLVVAFGYALGRYEHACLVHNGPLSAAVFLDQFVIELSRPHGGGLGAK